MTACQWAEGKILKYLLIEKTEEMEQEETEEVRSEKRARTLTETDIESTQSRQKKGQLKSIFLSDFNKEAIVKFVKQRAELYEIQRQARMVSEKD